MKEKKDILDKFSEAKLMVVGDIMVDEYVWCAVDRISPEAPVPIACVESTTSFLGGAANVANNVSALGANVTLLGVAGNDSEFDTVCDLLKQSGMDTKGVVVDDTRPTTIKKRIMANSAQLLRVDKESKDEINLAVENRLIQNIEEYIGCMDILIIADYCKGVITDRVAARIIELAKINNIRVLVDSKNIDLKKYSGVYLIKPNQVEAEAIAGVKFTENFENLRSVGTELVNKYDSNFVITLGSAGIAMFDGNKFSHNPTYAQEVYDVSGAGDTVMATMGVSLAVCPELYIAVELANIAAGSVVSHLGTGVCDIEVLYKALSI